jgi:hypothetical protein
MLATTAHVMFRPLSAFVCLLMMPLTSWSFMVSPQALTHQRTTSLSFQMPLPTSTTTETVDDQTSWQKPLTIESVPVILETLESILCSPECQRDLQMASAAYSEDSWKTIPVRKIAGGRYEIFLAKAGEHSYDYALKLMGQVIDQLPVEDNGFPRLFMDPQEVIDVLVDDATEKARKSSSSRLATADFENFSILVTTGRCEAQPMHIDAIVTQGVYFITDQSPATKTWYPKGESSITTPRALTDTIWRKLVPGIDSSVWDEIRYSLENQESSVRLTARECIRRYGDLLLMPEDLHENAQLSVPRGAVRMVQPPGLHAGPSSDENRVVMFFSEQVKENPLSSDSSSWSSAPPQLLPLESYNPDVQRTAIQLLVELQAKIWPTLSLEARHVMMKLLQSYVQNRPIRPTEVVLGGPPGAAAVTNVAQWLWDCHHQEHPKNLSHAATEIIDAIAWRSADKTQHFWEACAYYCMEGDR